jgi:ABC-type lipoprotein release transport system permease subunit
MMDADALEGILREAPAVNNVNLSLDATLQDQFYDAIKRLPMVSGTALQRLSLASFRETMAILVAAMANIYTVLAVVIAFGVVYNSARISLSERARELASLRVLGFSQGEVLRILFLELALLTLLAQPPGWALGYGLAWTLKTKNGSRRHARSPHRRALHLRPGQRRRAGLGAVLGACCSSAHQSARSCRRSQDEGLNHAWYLG